MPALEGKAGTQGPSALSDATADSAAPPVTQEAPPGGKEGWQGHSDSNRGPSVLETDALTS